MDYQILSILDEDIKKYKCDVEGCDYKVKQKSNLKGHKADIHDIGVKWHKCDVDGCEKKFKRKGTLKRHKADIHDIGVKWHKCDVEGCNHKVKQKGHLKIHKAYVHDIGVKWHKCDVEGCNHKVKQKGNLKIHKADIHDIGVKWHKCDVEGCNHKVKRKGTLKRHKADVHDIGVKWHKCDVEGCNHKVKQKGHLKIHKADIHDIGVKWHKCDVEGCDYKVKQKGSLKIHKAYVHDIGEYTCDFCYCNRNSKIKYTDKHGTHSICRKCYKKSTGKESRIEHIWSDYIDEKIEYLSSSDKSLKSNGGCLLYRPDKLYISIDRVEIDECDEYQHTRKNGSYACDEKRISDIYDEEGINGKDLVVTRWNPHNYKPPDEYTKIKTREERMKLFIKLKQKLREKRKLKDKIHIYYMFYDIDNPRISRRIPYTMIYNEEDIDKL